MQVSGVDKRRGEEETGRAKITEEKVLREERGERNEETTKTTADIRNSDRLRELARIGVIGVCRGCDVGGGFCSGIGWVVGRPVHEFWVFWTSIPRQLLAFHALEQGIDVLGQLVVGEGIGMRSLAVEFLLRKLHKAFIFMGFPIVLALLALVSGPHDTYLEWR